MINNGTAYQTTAAFYSALVVNAALQGGGRVIDVTPDAQMPVYAIYRDGRPTRAVIISYTSDPTFATNSTVTIYVASKPCSATIQRLIAPTVTEQRNITWAGLTWANSTTGLPSGTEISETALCDAIGACPVFLPPQSVALVSFDYHPVNNSSASDRVGAQMLAPAL